MLYVATNAYIPVYATVPCFVPRRTPTCANVVTLHIQARWRAEAQGRQVQVCAVITDWYRKKKKSSTSAKPPHETADKSSSTKYATTKAEQKFEEVQRKRVGTHEY